MNSRTVWIAAAVSLCGVAAARADKADVYAIVGAKVITVSGATLDSGTVVLRDGVIEAVGANVAVPPDARVIDATGLTVTPGLIDGFSGVGLPGASAGRGGPGGGAAPAAAPTPAASPLAPQALILERVRLADALRARDSGVTTALVVAREGVLPGRSAVVNLQGDKVEALAIKQPAAMHLHMATLNRQYPSSLMGTFAYARQALLDAQHYREVWAAYEKAPLGKKRPRYDAALAAWQDVLAGRLPLMVTASRENDIRRALALADEFKIKVAVAGAPQASRLSGLIKERKLPLLVTVNFDPPRGAGGGFGGFGGGADEEQQKKDIEDAERNPAELNKAGVSFALVSGHAPNFVAGVRKAIERGLPREAALRAITLAAAEVLGIADRTGSIETGKMANVVVWSAEPLTREARAKWVFVDGQLHEPAEEERPAGGRPAPTQEGGIR
jgi:imidazolonepropionase-like amidohydrolase